LRAVAESVPDGVVSADSQGTITYLNRGAERLFGWASTDLIGQPVTVLAPERLRDAHCRSVFRHAAVAGAPAAGTTIELTALRKDGREFPVEVSLARSEAPDGPLFTAVVRDVSHRKQVEGDLLSLNAQLEAANRELEAFSYSVSHDLRAPLRSIDSFSAILLEDCTDQLDERARDYLNRVRAACQRMSTLIDAMLSLSKVAREEMWHQAVDLSALAESVTSELQRSEPERNVRFIVAPGLMATGDATLLRVVIENLLANAWKFTSKRPDAVVEFGITDVGGVQSYFVRDNGAGFDPAYASRLFGAFQRLHAARDFPGTGIGLPTVQRIVHRHGGRVWASGTVGHGATFYFTLAPDNTAVKARASA
jgi:PAS domain S-box-containing protein